MKKSNDLNPNPYIFGLDADDIYSEDNFILSVIDQMVKTKADICVFNFSIEYEDPLQIVNAAGLIRDRENSQRVLESIYTSPTGAVSPLEVDVMRLSSLGWIKCYAPSVKLPGSADCTFEDFVFMAALLSAKVITTIDPERLPIQYLRRSTSICGQRNPENFTLHIPIQMRRFFEAVLDASKEDYHKIEKLHMAAQFTLYKFDQYTTTLQSLVESRAREDIQEPVLRAYVDAAENVRKFVIENITQMEEEQLIQDNSMPH